MKILIFYVYLELELLGHVVSLIFREPSTVFSRVDTPFNLQCIKVLMSFMNLCNTDYLLFGLFKFCKHDHIQHDFSLYFFEN